MESASSASKKRKISDDDEDDEEEKMEKFYALVKSIRDARDRWIMNNNSSSGDHVLNKEVAEVSNKTKKRKLEEEKHVVVWKPSFRREDFMEEADQMKKPPMISFATTSQTKERTDNDLKEKVKEGLDLTLSL